MNKLTKIALVIIVSLIIPFGIFYGVIGVDGVLNGDDSANPYTLNQVSQLFFVNQSTIDYNTLIPYRSYLLGAASLVQIIEYIASCFGLVHQFPIFLYICIYAIAASGMYILCRYIGIVPAVSVYSTLLFVLSPLFFNYTIYGWNFVLLSLGLLPHFSLLVLRSAQESSVKLAVGAGLIFGFACIQVQSYVFYSITLLIILGNLSNIEWKNRIRLYLLISLSAAMVNISTIGYYAFNMLDTISGTAYLKAPASLGTSAFFKIDNFTRGFGGLFNSQYEKTVTGELKTILSYFPTLLAVLAFSKIQIDRYVRIFSSILLITFFFWVLSLNRDALTAIPFANIIRDFSRSTIFVTFALPILNGIVLSELIKRFNSVAYKITILLLLCSFAFYYIKPWKDLIVADVPRELFDSRLATQKVSQDYIFTEKLLSNDQVAYRVLYLPISYNGVVESITDKNFRYGIRDNFALYSPKPGILNITDRNLADPQYYQYLINIALDNPRDLSQLGIRYVIARNDLSPINLPEIKNINHQLNQSVESLPIIFSSESIKIYEVNNNATMLVKSEKQKKENFVDSVVNNYGIYSFNLNDNYIGKLTLLTPHDEHYILCNMGNVTHGSHYSMLLESFIAYINGQCMLQDILADSIFNSWSIKNATNGSDNYTIIDEKQFYFISLQILNFVVIASLIIFLIL